MRYIVGSNGNTRNWMSSAVVQTQWDSDRGLSCLASFAFLNFSGT